MTTTSLAVLAVPGTRVVVYTPADEVTRQAVAGLLRGEGADARFPQLGFPPAAAVRAGAGRLSGPLTCRWNSRLLYCQ
jgi:hypothetical protein